MHRVRVFLNGAASSSASQDWRGQISRGLFRSEVQFVAADTREALECELRKAAREEVDVVISVGGDGTFNTLLQELATTKTTFLVVPAGTANDLARELGITKKLRRAVECIRRDEVSCIDLISINGRFMATNGGIGLIADVALDINEWRRRVPGFRALMTAIHHHTYTLALLGQLVARRQKYYKVRVESPDYQRDIETPLLLVNNQPCVGGSFPVAPHTNNSDGRFNVTVFTHQSWSSLVRAIFRVKEGLPVEGDPDLYSFETASVKITSLEAGRDLVFFGDGELLSRSSSLDIKVHKSALRVFRPSPPVFEAGASKEREAALGEPNSL